MRAGRCPAEQTCHVLPAALGSDLLAAGDLFWRAANTTTVLVEPCDSERPTEFRGVTSRCLLRGFVPGVAAVAL